MPATTARPGPVCRSITTAGLLAATCAALPAQDPPAPRTPWRLADLTADVPWLELSGRQRTRFESLHGQFRADPAPPAAPRPDNEDQWFLRTSLRADLALDPFGATLELMDSRAFAGGGNENDRLVDTGTVNAFDVVQGYGSWSLGELGDGRHRVRAGRWAMSLGSRRFVIRNGYRNTINTFTGVDYRWQNDGGEHVHAFWTLPVRRLPGDAPSLRDNEHEWDDQDLDRQFFGVFTTRRLDARTTLETYVFGLREDEPGSLMRELYTPGMRLFRPAQRGDWFLEAEAAFQFGESRLSANGPTLDHAAYFVHGSIGYRGDCSWEPTVRVAYDHATGDRDPTDGVNNRFDRLFGAPRFEYGPTGLWGAIQRSNFRSPELRVSIRPSRDTWLMLNYRDLRLESSRDQWVGSGVRDATGQSGSAVGRQVELRARWDVLPQNMYVEVGGALLFAGSFLERAPNSQGGADSRYGYVEMIWVL